MRAKVTRRHEHLHIPESRPRSCDSINEDIIYPGHHRLSDEVEHVALHPVV